MITIRKMTKDDVSILHNIALSAFPPDVEKYGICSPLLKKIDKIEYSCNVVFAALMIYTPAWTENLHEYNYAALPIIVSLFDKRKNVENLQGDYE